MPSPVYLSASILAAPPWWLSYVTGVGAALVAFVLWMVALDDAIRRPEWEYPPLLPVGAQRTVWLAIVLLGNLAGSAVYYALVMRPHPRRRE